MKRLNRNESILSGLLALTCLVIYHRVVITPWRTQVNLIQQQLQEAKQTVVTSQADFERLTAQAAASPSWLSSREILQKFDQSNDRLSTFVREIASDDQKGLFRIVRLTTLPTVVPAENAPHSEYSKTPVSLDVEASFPTIGKFLERLEDAPLLAEIDSLEIYRVDGDLKKCSARIKLLSYVVKK